MVINSQLYFFLYEKQNFYLFQSVFTCPSNFKALPDTSGLCNRTQTSLIKYRVITLSVQSNTMSYLYVELRRIKVETILSESNKKDIVERFWRQDFSQRDIRGLCTLFDCWGFKICAKFCLHSSKKRIIVTSYALHLLARLMALLWPTAAVSCAICRCMFETSMVSSSRRPKVPIPLEQRYKAAGQPSPPQPITKALEALSFIWPC